MAELRGLSVKVPIKFSEKAQRDLYETCMGYKKLAELRGEENERLRELVCELYEDQCYECRPMEVSRPHVRAGNRGAAV